MLHHHIVTQKAELPSWSNDINGASGDQLMALLDDGDHCHDHDPQTDRRDFRYYGHLPYQLIHAQGEDEQGLRRHARSTYRPAD
eukprot:scaffold5497_cov135-Cylindrotheca_fusiformis.AAC.2